MTPITRSVAPNAAAIRCIAFCASIRCIATTRTTFTLDDSLAQQARRLGVNVSAAAREGVAAAVRVALGKADRAAYQNRPETVDEFWVEAERWGAE
ncbi:MAG: type II toxin-antitoxin system CcdA family antitoxin [Ilumatobacteraceae bacterium]